MTMSMRMTWSTSISIATGHKYLPCTPVQLTSCLKGFSLLLSNYRLKITPDLHNDDVIVC